MPYQKATMPDVMEFQPKKKKGTHTGKWSAKYPSFTVGIELSNKVDPSACPSCNGKGSYMKKISIPKRGRSRLVPVVCNDCS